MKQGQGPRSWTAELRTWWLTVATAFASIALLMWAAWIVSIDPGAPAPTTRHADAAVREPQGFARHELRSISPHAVAAAVDQSHEQDIFAREVREAAPSANDGESGPQAPAPVIEPAATPHEQRGPRESAPQEPPREAVAAPEPAPATDAAPPADRDADARRARRALSGWVFDEDGAGVASIRVVADARRMFADGQSPPLGLRAQSDGSGAFAFAQVPDGEYQLRTDATAEYDSASAVVRAGTDSVVLTVKPKSGRALVVHGLVESAHGGKALDGVRVELVGRPATSAFSDAQGRYSLRIDSPGRVQSAAVRFTRKGYRDFVAPMDRAAGDIVQNARLEEVGDASTLAGTVHGNDGTAVNGATIELYSAERSRSYRAATDRNGAFSIAGVEQATDYRLWVRPAARYRDRTLDNVIIGGSMDVVVEALSSAKVSGRFVTPEGHPVPAFTMLLTPAFGSARAIPVTSNGDGAFMVSDVPEGPFALSTRAAPLLSVSGLEASSRSSGDLRVPLDVGAYRLEGTLASDDGRPVGGARLSLHWSSGNGPVSTSSRETVTDATGYFLFTQLGAGPHTLAVTAAGHRALQSAVAVGPSNAPIALTLQRGH